METVLSLEPAIMQAMDYDLIIHTPYRAFEGQLLEMKANLVLGFNLEEVRPHSTQFFSKAQIGDAVFLFPPSQIALAGLKYGLDQLNKSPELLKEYLMKLFRIDLGYAKPEDTVTIDKLMVKLDEVIDYVVTAAMDISEEDRIRIRNKFSAFATLYHDRTRRNQNSASNSHDSDDEESG